jgi:putative phosphoesterase
MRIGILSDTHDQLARTSSAVETLVAQGAEVLIHCGDITSPEIVEVCSARPCYYVLGNNDDDVPGLRRAINATDGICLNWYGEITLAEKRLAVVHGHLTSDLRRVLAQNPDYLLYGHSHHASDDRRGGTRWINPGALHRAAQYTVAVLDLATDELHMVSIDPTRSLGSRSPR